MGEGRGAKLYGNCAGEVRMIAFYCPLSPQVSARKVLCILMTAREGGGGLAVARASPLAQVGFAFSLKAG